jgi:hypothetical protein
MLPEGQFYPDAVAKKVALEMPKAIRGSFDFWKPEILHGDAMAGRPRFAASKIYRQW